MIRCDGYTLDEVREILRVRCAEAGGVSPLARELGISAGYIFDVLGGRSEPGQAILDALGLEKLSIYRHSGQ